LVDTSTNKTEEIEVRAAESGNGIPNIELNYVSNETDYIILAQDPSGIYLSAIFSSSVQSNFDPSQYQTAFASSALGVVSDSSYLVVPQYQVVGTIIIVLTLLSAIQTAEDFISLYQNPPRLVNWNWLYEDRCWTGKQMSEIASVGLFTAEHFIGVPGFSEIGQFFKIADEGSLDLLRISQMGAEWDIQQRIEQFNGIVRVRLYRAPVPIIQPIGFCLEPLNMADANSIVDWVGYGLKHDEILPFERLFYNLSEIGYGYQIEGGQSKSKADFLSWIMSGLPNAPRCDGYVVNSQYGFDYLSIWTSNWSPQFKITEMCYIECFPANGESSIAALGFRKNDAEYTFEGVWVNNPDEFTSFFSGQNLIV
jgi:hypothetical protein